VQLFVKRIRPRALALVQHLEELRQLWAKVRAVLGSAFVQPQAEGTRRLENAGVVGK
jgi:head-tail adaptor